jgi:hypothetical protein
MIEAYTIAVPDKARYRRLEPVLGRRASRQHHALRRPVRGRDRNVPKASDSGAPHGVRHALLAVEGIFLLRGLAGR